MKKLIPYALIAIVAIVFYYLGQYNVEPKEKIVIQKQIDTIKVEVKRIERQIEVKYKERERLKDIEKGIVYEDNCKEIVDNLKSQLANCDTIVMMKDNIIYKERKVIEYKDVLLDSKEKKKPFIIGFGAEQQNNEYPFNVNAGLKINDIIILGGVNTKGQAQAKVLWNF